MERSPDTLMVRDLRELFVDIEFPEYQREPDVWSREQKQRLIDSILRGFDISSVYLYRREDDGLECIDGRQRLNTIMSFLQENPSDEADNGFPIRVSNEISATLPDVYAPLNGERFCDLDGHSELGEKALKEVLDYELTVIYLSGVHEPDEFNLQFLRLNLGALINAGEKLHAMVGGMRDAIFAPGGLGAHSFLDAVSIPTRRYAKEQAATQILLQVFSWHEHGDFTRARHVDLQRFLKRFADVNPDHPVLMEVVSTLDGLESHAAVLGPLLRNRAMTLSVVVLAWVEGVAADRRREEFVDFIVAFIERLQWQVDNMKRFEVDNRYPYLVEFQRHLTQASVERPAVARRHDILSREWARWQESGDLDGDDAYRSEEGVQDPPRLGT